MSDLRAAALQALGFTMRDFATIRDFDAARAVLQDALRAALAQQDVAEAACGNMEQQEAEPAGVVTGKLGTRVSLDAPTLRKGDKVYAAPLARKPLSDQEIQDMLPTTFIRCPLDALWFARAIERAHGIGVGDE